MKLNNKGYLLVEIIVASVLAMIMMYFLIDITVNLKNINEDYYTNTKLETDQVLMIRDVMKDLTNNTLVSILVDNNTDDEINTVTFTLKNKNNVEFKTLITIDDQIFKYGKIDSDGKYNENVFVKTLDQTLNINDTTIENLCYIDNEYKSCDDIEEETKISKGLININIPAINIYSGADYGIKLLIPYSYGTINISEIPPIIPSDYLYYTSLSNDKNKMDLYVCYSDDGCKTVNDLNPDSEFTINFGYSYVGGEDDYGVMSVIDPKITANDEYMYFTSNPTSSTIEVMDESQSLSMELLRCDLNGENCNKVSDLAGYFYVYNEEIINSSDNDDTSEEESGNTSEEDGNTSEGETQVDVASTTSFTPQITVNAIKEIVHVPETPVNLVTTTAFTPQIIVNDNYLVYTTYKSIDTDNNIVTFDIYKCKADGTECKKLTTSKANYYFDIIDERAISGNINTQITLNDKYLYYSSYDLEYDSDEILIGSYMKIYQCNIETDECLENEINNSNYYIDDTGATLTPKIAANNDYLYYTSYGETTDDTETITDRYMAINICNPDGSNCINDIKTNFYLMNGTAIEPEIKVSDNYLYYTSFSEANGNMQIYKCDKDGTNCSNNIDINYYMNEDTNQVLIPQITVNNESIYYSTYDTTDKKMQIYKCDINIEKCSTDSYAIAAAATNFADLFEDTSLNVILGVVNPQIGTPK